MAIWWWSFAIFIALFLTLDLGFRRRHTQTSREALALSIFWVVLACLFTGVIALWYPDNAIPGRKPALEFFTGYLVEKSLSLDNLFVIASIFTSLSISHTGQQRALSWGIMGAIVMRLIMILIGTALFAHFHWMPLLFGLILLYTGLKMGYEWYQKHKSSVTETIEQPVNFGFLKRFIPLTSRNDTDHFFVIEDGIRKATPLFVALVQVESCDLMFAIDSIPAIFAITSDPFIVVSSNVFAIFGLRALYLLLSHSLHLFRFLHPTLSVLLTFVGIKMLLSLVYPIPLPLAFAIMAGILGAGIVASLRVKE